MSRRIVRHERRVQILEALKVCMTRKSFYETTIKGHRRGGRAFLQA